MTNIVNTNLSIRCARMLTKLGLTAGLLLSTALISSGVFSATPVLATKPLSTTNAVVPPNLMFVFDTSASMSKNLANDALDDAAQCKAATKNRNGNKITALSRAGTVLTITETGGDYRVNNLVYLAVPGNSDFSGVYKIVTSNYVAGTSAVCDTWNAAVVINNPYCAGAVNANPLADPPVTACSCGGAAPANSGNTASNLNLGGGTDARCYWYDPKDNAIGSVCTHTSGGVAGTAGTVLTVTVANTGTSGAFSDDQILDARILIRNDDSKCYNNEPPLVASKVQSLFYDPSVEYIPPPKPKLVGLGTAPPDDRLPSMTNAYTTGWTKVRIDGTRINAAGEPITNANGTSCNAAGSNLATCNNTYKAPDGSYNFKLWQDMVYCDTPDRPAAFASDKLWHESARCKRNTPADTSSIVNSSPRYPYPFPGQTDGGVSSPSKTNFHIANVLHQYGVAKLVADNPVASLYAFGETYNYASPFYYNVRPIEYCDSAKLNNCTMSNAATGVYTFPAYVRYCKTQAQATDTSTSPGAAACQGIYTGTAGTDFRFARYGLFERVDVTPLVNSYAKSAGRTDCLGATCTYDEEMTNLANWYAYYRTRIQLMKSAAGRTFDTLTSQYRVGLITVEGYNTAGNYLPIKDFVTGANLQKQKWFENLYSRWPVGGTSLRDVLGTVGRIYAGKKPVTGFSAVDDDPMQYSCQKNYTLLTTDGYWNGPAGLKVDATAIGNQDAAPAPFPQREGTVAAPDTLADVARYYYQTDIRNGAAFDNCLGALGDDVCADASIDPDKNTQRMTTFTLGLGVDGSLSYTSDYKTPTGDFIGLSAGTLRWPQPGPDDGNTTFTALERATVDDLWHAAVNGNGTYFSARNPTQLISGISSTLVALGDITGTASATYLSNVTPEPGDNYAYSARYVTGSWTGNLFARTIDGDGVLSESALWCVENESSVIPPCVPSAASGLYTKVAANSDTRSIFANLNGALTPFKYVNLAATQQAFFSSAYQSTRLSQWGSYVADQLVKINSPAVNGIALVDYLRGQTGFDTREANDLSLPGTPNDNRLYRQRTAVLGDIIDSDPISVGKAKFDYLDAGYSDFVISTAVRPRTVYVGANDGMLHAFNADTGEERWAYVPTTVMPNMWMLADNNYRNIHNNFVNAKLTVADVYLGGSWKTILVSGLGQGGRGYFALDITDPALPSLLWEFDSSSEANLGYSYGQPIITKKTDGTWVVLLSSGYNNTADGKGRLFVLNAASGAKLAEIATTEGSSETPSGLAQISAFVNNPNKNNQAQYVYGGDLAGNIWRFDLDASTVLKLATLTTSDLAGVPQPISTAPTLSEIDGKRVVVVGTGKYIESSDLLPENYIKQTLYVIKDDNLAATIVGLRGQMIEQTLTDTSGTRTGSSNPVSWQSTLGWFVDFPSSETSGERQNVKALLYAGVLVVPTIIPPTGTCDVNGRGWSNIFNLKTGGTIASTEITSPIAGLYLVFSKIDKDKFTIGIDSTDARSGNGNEGGPPDKPPPGGCTGNTCSLDPVTGDFSGHRAVWRELLQ